MNQPKNGDIGNGNGTKKPSRYRRIFAQVCQSFGRVALKCVDLHQKNGDSVPMEKSAHFLLFQRQIPRSQSIPFDVNHELLYNLELYA